MNFARAVFGELLLTCRVDPIVQTTKRVADFPTRHAPVGRAPERLLVVAADGVRRCHTSAQICRKQAGNHRTPRS